MPGHAWPRPPKITSSISSFTRYLPACNQLYNFNSFWGILKLKNPGIWLAESIFAFNDTHLKLHDQFEALIDMILHAKNQIYNSITFWDIKVFKASMGMPDHSHLNLHNQFITLIYMKLNAQNQRYTSFNSLSGHAWAYLTTPT